jgi:hypothetical protein
MPEPVRHGLQKGLGKYLPEAMDGRTQYAMLHAAIANSNKSMYDFLIRLGASDRVTAFGLTPLKLAVRLGKLNMFDHVIHSRMVSHWKWGPVRADFDPTPLRTTHRSLLRLPTAYY